MKGFYMSQINPLLNQIAELNNKIEDEKSISTKRNLQIESDIRKLEDEKKRAGFKCDFATVDKCNRKIDSLLEDKNFDYKKQYKSDIENCKKEIIYIILDYYKKGIYIEDIIKLENISENISSKWLEISDFGEYTGFLFVEEKGNNCPCWYYANPITGIKISSPNLDKLIIQIYEKNEELLIFNEDLANKSYEKDLKDYQIEINNKLDNLRVYKEGDVSDSFNYLRMNANKFNKDQLTQICQIMVNEPLLNVYADDFNHIINSNKDKIDSNFIKETYKESINQILLTFHTNKDMNEIFKELRGFADQLTEEQVRLLFSLIIKYSDHFYESEDYRYIINFVDNKFDNIDVYHFKVNIYIENILTKLNNNSYNYTDVNYILYSLKPYANHFTKDQIEKFCNISINRYELYKCNICKDNIKYIIDINKSKINEDLFKQVQIKVFE